MANANFRFYGPLNDFLPKQQRQIAFVWPISLSVTIKDVIESLGVPHPEVGLLLINSQVVDFTYRMQADDQCSIYPAFYQLDVSPISPLPIRPSYPLRFVLDVHLGKLANFLRMMGFDTLYQNSYDDPELAQISNQENRILLTRDRGLLMRNQVQYGYFVRNTQPIKQLREILLRYDLTDQIAPFSRCLVCNGLLQPVAKEVVLAQLPPHVQAHQDSFFQCTNCGKAYWEGSHYKRMKAFVADLIEPTSPDNSAN